MSRLLIVCKYCNFNGTIAFGVSVDDPKSMADLILGDFIIFFLTRSQKNSHSVIT